MMIPIVDIAIGAFGLPYKLHFHLPVHITPEYQANGNPMLLTLFFIATNPSSLKSYSAPEPIIKKKSNC